MLFTKQMRYGGAFLRLRSAVQGAVARFGGLYAVQASGAGFAEPLALWRSVGLEALATERFDAFLGRELGTSAGATKLANELVSAVTLVNYNQVSS
jgi:hypothetical protein